MTGVRLSNQSRFLLQPSSDNHLLWVMARGRRGMEFGWVLVNKVAYATLNSPIMWATMIF